MTQYHNPVMLNPSLEGLNIKPDGVYTDVTFGGGSHSRGILDHLNENGRLISFDQDPDAYKNKIEDPRFVFVAANFSYLSQYLKYYKIKCVDGILADFGVSSHQFDTSDRGFSIRTVGRLDMRMNQSQTLDAYTVINHYEEDALSNILFNYGELRNAKSLARSIILARSVKELVNTQDLISVVKPLISEKIKNKILAQIFQAIRIEVNSELEVLQSFLIQAVSLLNPGGRLVCISYHSLEDRLVKRFFHSGNFEGEVKKDFYGNPLVNLERVGKMIIPSKDEIKNNGRARSAKLRIAEKK